MTKLTHLNFFKTRCRDPAILEQQILTTRLFLLLFAAALLVLLIYTSISERSQTYTISQPTLETFQKLIQIYPNTLQCTCQQISILPSRFVKTTPRFHQVCSSDFIKQSWIDFTFEANIQFIYVLDIRNFFSSMWQIIANLCQMAINSVDDALVQFANEPTITSRILTQNLLEVQIQSRLEEGRRSANERFTREFTTIQTITQVNAYTTGLITNFFVFSAAIPGTDVFPSTVIMFEQQYKMAGTTRLCMCHRDRSCQTQAAFYQANYSSNPTFYQTSRFTLNITIPGIFFDCLPILATFASSLECFYNQSCVDILQQVFNKSIKVSILSNKESSRFPITMSLNKIIEELFLEEIINSTSFSDYYEACAPISCTYTYSQRFDRLFIITTLVGLIGGLNAALRLIAPVLIRWILYIKKKFSRYKHGDVTVSNHNRQQSIWRKLWIKIKQKIFELDVFLNDPHYRLNDQQSRQATRIYFVLMIFNLLVLIIYTSRTIQTITITEISPLQEQFENLQKLYGSDLRCPCSNVTIPHRSFLQIKPTYHQLCSSAFVQPSWYQSLYYGLGYTLAVDFAPISSAYFRALSFFCSLASETFNAAYAGFLSSSFVHPQPLPRLAFTQETDALIQTFLNTTRDEFLYTISLANDLLRVDQYVSGLETNTYLRVNYVDEESTPSPYRTYPTFKMYNSQSGSICNCGQDIDCSLINGTDPYVVHPMGISMRCSLLDTVLESSLACWFDHDCFDRFYNFMVVFNPDLQNNNSLLNNSISSHFLWDSTMKSIVSELMIESYNMSVSYSQYYDTCHPVSCTYTVVLKNSLIYMMTTIIGLLGGLNVVLRLLSPLTLKLRFRRKRQVQTTEAACLEVSDFNPPSILGFKNRWLRLKNQLQQLNFFATGSTQINTLRKERTSTRIYLVLLSISVTIIVIFTVVPTNSINKIQQLPSILEYQHLLMQHASSLDCPCSQVSISHQDLLAIIPTYHQLCSSDLINPVWLSLMSNNNISLIHVFDDYRVLMGVYFRMLSTLCARAQVAVGKVIDGFLMKSLLSSSAMSKSQFLSRMDDVISQFKQTTASSFSRSIEMLRGYFHGNTFVSSYGLSWYFWSNVMEDGYFLWSAPVIFNDSCSCGTRSDCISIRPFFPIIPGLVLGCSVMEGVMRSTLVSFFNQTLIDNIGSSMVTNSSNRFFARSLNVSRASRFQVDTLIHDLVNNLFVEEWSFNVSYESFYDRCDPLYCSYVIQERNNALFVVSRLLALYGGLTISWRFLAPYLTRLFMEGFFCFRRAQVVTC